MSIAQREYSIPKRDLLWAYSWTEILELVQNLPVEKVITIYDGMKKDKINDLYLEALCDRDSIPVSDDQMIDFIEKLNKAKNI